MQNGMPMAHAATTLEWSANNMQKTQSENDIYLHIIDNIHILIRELPISEYRKNFIENKCVEAAYHGLSMGKVLSNA